MSGQSFYKPCKKCRGVKNLNCLISVQKIQKKISNNIDSTINSRQYEDKGKIWCDVETKNGVEIIEGTNTMTLETHQFTMRYNEISKNIDKDYQIQWKGIIYVIDKITNINEQDKWIVIKAHVKGKNSVVRNI